MLYSSCMPDDVRDMWEQYARLIEFLLEGDNVVIVLADNPNEKED